MARVLVCVLALVGAAGGPLAAGDLPEIKAGGVLKVVAQKDEAPELFNYAAGEPGFEREIIEGFARLHGLKVEPVAVATSAERIPALLRGAGDVIIGIVDLPERRKLVDFSLEVIPVRHMVLTRKPSPVIKTVEEFRAARIGVVKNTSWAQVAIAAGAQADSMAQYPDRQVLFNALREGKITATVITLTDGTLAMKTDPDLQAGVFLGDPGSSAFAVRKGDTQLHAALDEYLGNFRKSPSWNRLIVKYFGDQALTVLGRR
jgi:ABC-type amino acid transport substrate-binding protein